MDFRYIVENNESYKEKNLREKDKAFVNGMRCVLDNTVSTFIDNYFPASCESITDQIKREIVSDAIDELAGYIEGDIYETIVSIIESYSDDEEQ